MLTLKMDLLAVKDVAEEQLDEIILLMSNDRSEELDWAVYADSIGKSESIHSVIRIINYLGETFARARVYDHSLEELDNFMSTIIDGDPDAAEGWERLKSNYSRLEDFFKKKKVEILKSRFPSISELTITVDARPVYSLDRKRIERFIFPLILNIETSDDQNLICEFYEDFLDQLSEEVGLAKAKIESLKLKIAN